MPPPPPLLELMEELVEDALLLIPPDDPAHLFRAALVCKRWCRLISGRRFRRRYREFHRTPPMLGYLINQCDYNDNETFVTRFVPSASFGQPTADFRGWRALDSRHGRVLFHNYSDHSLRVWDPIASKRLELPKLPRHTFPDTSYGLKGAVLCAAGGGGGGCDNLHCSCGTFLVAVVGFSGTKASACVYSSEDGAWGELSYIHHVPELVDGAPCALVGNALHIMFFRSNRVLKYDLTTREMNMIDLPRTIITHPRNLVLMATDEGNLGFARVEDFRLHLWSREAGRNIEARWAQIRVVDLKTLLPVDARSSSPYVVRFMDGIKVIFVRMDDDLFSIDLKSGQVRKVHEDRLLPDHFVPYMSFYTPAMGAVLTDVEPRASASST